MEISLFYWNDKIYLILYKREFLINEKVNFGISILILKLID